jgi:DNA-binding helix-hairpin-helix protein with protein kinase domain
MSRPAEIGPPSRRLKTAPSVQRPAAVGRWPARSVRASLAARGAAAVRGSRRADRGDRGRLLPDVSGIEPLRGILRARERRARLVGYPVSGWRAGWAAAEVALA